MRKFQPAAASALSSRPPASGVRGVIDSLVSGSLVDLFAAYSVAVAPLPRSSRPELPKLPELSATVSFIRAGNVRSHGRITLSVPAALTAVMSPQGTGSLQFDWTRELANQLMGRVKNRLLSFDVRLRVGVASLIDSAELSQQLHGSLGHRVYVGRTLRGEAVVTFDGLPQDSELSYIGPSSPGEGAAILF